MPEPTDILARSYPRSIRFRDPRSIDKDRTWPHVPYAALIFVRARNIGSSFTTAASSPRFKRCLEPTWNIRRVSERFVPIDSRRWVPGIITNVMRFFASMRKISIKAHYADKREATSLRAALRFSAYNPSYCSNVFGNCKKSDITCFYRIGSRDVKVVVLILAFAY